MKCEILDLGLVEYGDADNIQRKSLGDVIANTKESFLILAEFLPVYTIGRSGTMDNLLVSLDFLEREKIGLYRTDRGGDITVHSPGQLVVYPVFNLAYFKKDLGWYLRALEETVLDLLVEYGIIASRKRGFTGAWVNDVKIASIGISVSKWVTYNGISINVNNNLGYFDFINPCGIKQCRVTSVSKIKGRPIDIPDLKKGLIEKFKIVFGLEIYANLNAPAVA